MNIVYQQGHVTYPTGSGLKLIASICNDAGIWKETAEISRKWPQVQVQYNLWYERRPANLLSLPKEYFQQAFLLGNVQLVEVESDIQVINMIARHRSTIKHLQIPPDIWFMQCLEKVAKFAKARSASFHLQKTKGLLGPGVGWKLITQSIEKYLCDEGIPVTIYTHPDEPMVQQGASVPAPLTVA